MPSVQIPGYFVTRLIFVLILIPFSNCAIRKPKDSDEFSTFLAKARAGDTFELLPITYSGEFLVNVTSELAEYPITIRGDTVGVNKTILTNPNGTVLNIQASNYIFRTMLILKSQRGIDISGGNIELDGITLKDCKEGIVVSSVDGTEKENKNKFQALTIQNVDTGIIIKSGTSGAMTLQHSSVTSSGVSLEVEKDSCCSIFDNNVFNGYVNLRGNQNIFKANVANGGMLVTGCDNEFTSNVVLQMKLTKKCENKDKGLNIFQNSLDQNFE